MGDSQCREDDIAIISLRYDDHQELALVTDQGRVGSDTLTQPNLWHVRPQESESKLWKFFVSLPAPGQHLSVNEFGR